MDFSLITPMNQPLNSRRLLANLQDALSSSDYMQFKLIVAYAKSGPLLRMQEDINNWKKKGKYIGAIFGIDQKGTSFEALKLGLELFDDIYITRHSGITFHPKLYIFDGPQKARAFIGSNNLTVGGTEKNFETAIDIELDIPDDNSYFDKINSAWNELLPDVCSASKKLDYVLLEKFLAEGLVLTEKLMKSTSGNSDDAYVRCFSIDKHSSFNVIPESPLPKRIADGQKNIHQARGLAIQVKPHRNGEIFLSVSAALQNPIFLVGHLKEEHSLKSPLIHLILNLLLILWQISLFLEMHIHLF